MQTLSSSGNREAFNLRKSRLVIWGTAHCSEKTKSLFHVQRIRNSDQDKSNFLLGNPLRRLNAQSFYHFTAIPVFTLLTHLGTRYIVFWVFSCGR